MAPRTLDPQSIVALALSSPVAAFVESIDPACLIVRIDEAEGELVKVLRATSVTGGEKLAPTIGFETRTTNEPPRQSRRPAGTFNASNLEIRLARGSYFIVPIRKRSEAGKEFIERVSIGRARNNDVVLRHESVSKLHAWIRRDDDGAYFVGDAASRNGTRVNGEPLVAHKPRRLAPGDELLVGAVEAVFTPSSVLWNAIRSGG